MATVLSLVNIIIINILIVLVTFNIMGYALKKSKKTTTTTVQSDILDHIDMAFEIDFDTKTTETTVVSTDTTMTTHTIGVHKKRDDKERDGKERDVVDKDDDNNSLVETIDKFRQKFQLMSSKWPSKWLPTNSTEEDDGNDDSSKQSVVVIRKGSGEAGGVDGKFKLQVRTDNVNNNNNISKTIVIKQTGRGLPKVIYSTKSLANGKRVVNTTTTTTTTTKHRNTRAKDNKKNNNNKHNVVIVEQSYHQSVSNNDE
ncbi:3',5'-cyclic-nucleotide phosphodiesterase regA-like [Oppia nitens]|uniref:3',5'-cyclic-nucleotide phosphodiesterase regA-like n=1 Tax=Oppia nitens TaxID=1686743 RepID=UPI0023DC80D8|nr:3',5'-cyclic-nucleotide phosphodiesterase regA-like [Oppia nitens]